MESGDGNWKGSSIINNYCARSIIFIKLNYLAPVIQTDTANGQYELLIVYS